MAEAAAYITVDPGTPTTGLWCEHCQLPSLVRVPLTTMGSKGVQSLGTATLCTEHELMEVEIDE